MTHNAQPFARRLAWMGGCARLATISSLFVSLLGLAQTARAGEVCRTTGFWGRHAGIEKPRSVNIAAAVIGCADGDCVISSEADFLEVCGEKISSPDTNPPDGTADINDSASVIEALCVSEEAPPRLQLARELTVTALNCVLSGAGADCEGSTLFGRTFMECNHLCRRGADVDPNSHPRIDQVTQCIARLSCLNQGGDYLPLDVRDFCRTGLCFSGVPCNAAEPCEDGSDCRDLPRCDDPQLVNAELGFDFEPPGPAGSAKMCAEAVQTPCAIIDAHEGPNPHPGVSVCLVDSNP